MQPGQYILLGQSLNLSHGWLYCPVVPHCSQGPLAAGTCHLAWPLRPLALLPLPIQPIHCYHHHLTYLSARLSRLLAHPCYHHRPTTYYNQPPSAPYSPHHIQALPLQPPPLPHPRSTTTTTGHLSGNFHGCPPGVITRHLPHPRATTCRLAHRHCGCPLPPSSDLISHLTPLVPLPLVPLLLTTVLHICSCL